MADIYSKTFQNILYKAENRTAPSKTFNYLMMIIDIFIDENVRKKK